MIFAFAKGRRPTKRQTHWGETVHTRAGSSAPVSLVEINCH